MEPKRPMAIVVKPPSGLRYSVDSIQAIDLVKERAGDLLDYYAKQRALDTGREVVTADDVLNAIAVALQEVIAETATAGHGG